MVFNLVSIGLITFTVLSMLIDNIVVARQTKAIVEQHILFPKDYSEYHFRLSERLKYIGMAACLIFAVVYLFYRSTIFSLIVAIAAIFYPKIKLPQLIKKQQDNLISQFRVALNSIDTSISSGSSPTNAILDTLDDLYRMYTFDSDIIQEFEMMKSKIEMNEPLADVLLDFAQRSHVEDVQNFCHVFISSLQTGGKRVEIIRSAIAGIVEKMEIKKEIELMIAETKFQANIMVLMPIFIMLMLSGIAPDYVEPLFTTIFGKIAVTVVIIMIITSYKLSAKIVDIEV